MSVSESVSQWSYCWIVEVLAAIVIAFSKVVDKVEDMVVDMVVEVVDRLEPVVGNRWWRKVVDKVVDNLTFLVELNWIELDWSVF